MGCFASKVEVQKEARSMAIDKAIEEDSKRLQKECKILLLGGGESGKSTIVKQMKIIHQQGYSEEERLSFIPTITKNTYESMQAVINAIMNFRLEISPAAKEAAAVIMKTQIAPERLTSALSESMAIIFAEPAAQEAISRSNQFYLMDSAIYFFENLKRISEPDYIPNEQDMLRARIKTTGIVETHFQIDHLSIHMFDVGGQRSERKKWIHCFEAVTSIIFCVALSEYDQLLLETGVHNRMAESLILFESVVNSRWFLRTSIILFLNKIDLFKIKLLKSPLELYFPEYKGGPVANKAAKFILWRFTQTNRARLNLYPHLTQATDTTNIKLVFAAVKVTILQNALKDSGMM